MTLLNTGSEATSLAIRLSRAITGRAHFIVMQGGYNGNHDELACNVFNSLEDIGLRVSPGEYPLRPLGAGTTLEHAHFVHAINFNDLESVRYVCRRYPVAALITEPVLQNIGVVRPRAGYLQGLRELADELGFLLIFDEVKTGFRHAIGGYSAISGVIPDLVVYGKAIANGYPLAMIGGRRRYMDYIAHVDASKRPFVAGTYNGHPVAVAAAISTVQYLLDNKTKIYPAVEALGQQIERGIWISLPGAACRRAWHGRDRPSLSILCLMHRTICTTSSATMIFRRTCSCDAMLIDAGVFFVPIATKQCSISCAHTVADVDFTLEQFERAAAAIW